MTEELAKTHLGMKHQKLANCHKALKLTIAVDRESLSAATERLLTRQHKHLKTAWDEYEEGMLRLQESAAQENLTKYEKDFETEHEAFHNTNQQAEEFLERFHLPPEVVEPIFAALAAANADVRDELSQDLIDVLDDAEGSLEKAPSSPLHAHVETLLRSVEEKLNQIFISTRESATLDPAGHAEVQTTFKGLKRSVLARVRKAQEKMSSSPMPASMSSTNSVSSGGSGSRSDNSFTHNYFQRQLFPKFTGESRDYLAFRKEWKDTVTPSHDDTFQLREIRRAMPSKLQPDLKNLRSMDEVWTVFDEEFGQVLDNVSGQVRRLLAFKVSKEAKTESEKFMELSCIWNEICADLRELDKLEALNHKPTVEAVGGCFPVSPRRTGTLCSA